MFCCSTQGCLEVHVPVSWCVGVKASLGQGPAHMAVKGQIVNILGFSHHEFSFTTSQLYNIVSYCRQYVAAVRNMNMNGRDGSDKTLFISRGCQLVICSLLTPL